LVHEAVLVLLLVIEGVRVCVRDDVHDFDVELDAVCVLVAA
jgi:hypothetical protein